MVQPPSADDNFIMIYGCAPLKKTDEYSFIARTFFQKLEGETYENGCIMLPGKNQTLTSWIPNGTGEVLIKSTMPLHFHGPEPESDETPNQGAF